MDIDGLRYFLTVAREENITRAAQALHISQPTLSRRMMQLEEEMGAPLFVRTNHNVTLTEQGLLFRRRAQDAVGIIDRAREEIAAHEEELLGMVCIGCGELQSVRELAALMSAFQKMHPHVKYELFSGSNEDIEERLRQGTLDLGLFLEPFQAAAYDAVRMKMREEWGVLLHESNPLCGRKVIRPGDLVGTLVVTVHVGSPVHEELRKWSGTYAQEMDFFAIYHALHSAVVLVQERGGAVICLRDEFQYPEMKFVPFSPRLTAGSLLAWRKGLPYARAAQAFIQFVQEESRRPE